MGGLVARFLSFTRVVRGGNISDSKVDTGAGVNITCEHFADSGDDSHPMPDDYCLLVRIPRTGNAAVAGYLDPKNASLAQLGEKRIYSRDADGDEVARVFLKNTGEIELVNPFGFVRLSANGNVDINGVIITPAGQVTLPSGQSVIADSMVVDGKELKDHVHSGVESGPSNTGPNQ